MSEEWGKGRQIQLLRNLTLRLPAIKGAGKLTRRVVEHYDAPPGTVRDFRLANGLLMRVDVSQKYERSMFFSPQLYEFRSTKLLLEHLKAGDTFVDVGANVGLFTLLAAHQVGSSGKVVAIEPDPDTFERLEWSISANSLSHVHAVQQAVSSVAGEMLLYRDLAGNTGGNSLSAHATEHNLPIPVQVNTLDAILDASGVQQVDVVKIDIEGWEVHALRGSRVLHQHPRPLILTEAHDGLLQRAGSSLVELDEMFEQFGFTGRSIGRRDRVYS